MLYFICSIAEANAQHNIEATESITIDANQLELRRHLDAASSTFRRAQQTIRNAELLARTGTAIDTLQYNISKASGLQALSINNATSATSFGQYFDAPATVNVSGVDFYAWKDNTTGGLTQNITVQVYLAGIDSLPVGVPLATGIVSVDTAFGGGNLQVLKRRMVFDEPAEASGAFVVVLSNNSANPVNFVNSSYTNGDGDGEWLCNLQLGSSWMRSRDIVVGGVPFNADFLVEPHVAYDFFADFLMTPTENTGDNTVEVTSSSVTDWAIQNRMYNIAASLNQTELSYSFDFGDGSAIVNNANALHTYANGDTQQITLTDTIFGWTNTITNAITKQWPGTLSTDEAVLNDVFLSPNPTRTDFDILNLKDGNAYDILIYDVTGKVIYKGNETRFNTLQWKSGVYFVKVTKFEHGTIKRLIVL